MKASVPPVERFAPAEGGLTREQVALRVAQQQTNKVKNVNSKSYKNIFVSNICTIFNLIALVVVIAVLAVGSFSNALFFVIIFANITVGIVQEIKAKRAIEKLSLVSAPTAVVIREGQRQEIPSSELVLDDRVLLEAGKQICADCVVLEGSIEVNESLLTGESVSVRKNPGDPLYGGSFVVSGSCTALADKVGEASYVQQLSAQAKQYKKPNSELMKAMKKIINFIGIIIIPMACLMGWNNYRATGGDIVETVTQTAGSIIGMIPAGMFLLTSVALAVGVINLAKKKTLVQDLYCIEMLARTTVLCLDKTGTLTDGNMSVQAGVPLTNQHDLPAVVRSVVTATKDHNLTAEALLRGFGEAELYEATAALPFSSARKLSGASFGSRGSYVLGAPEFIPRGSDPELDARIQRHAEEGLRVLLVAHSDRPLSEEDFPDRFDPIGLILLEDHIREDAPETIRHFRENGVALKVISGDNPATVANVAARVGIAGAEKYINLTGLSDEEVAAAATQYNVFGRVTPDQKAILIKALKAAKKTVAMTGDGVNDILAMKQADCSIAMAAGAEAARSVAHLVLLDSNFASMPSVVYEGRRVINNIQKSSSLFFMKTLFSLMLSLITILAGIAYPFTTSNMLLIEFFITGLSTFFLALQPNHNLVRGKFISTVVRNALPAAVVMVASVLAALALGPAVGLNEKQTSSMAVLAVTFTAYIVLAVVAWPWDRYRLILILCVFAGLVLAGTFLKGLIGIVAIPWVGFFTLVGILAVAFPVYLLMRFLFFRGELLIRWIRHRCRMKKRLAQKAK